jgi:hypothetical protein
MSTPFLLFAVNLCALISGVLSVLSFLHRYTEALAPPTITWKNYGIYMVLDVNVSTLAYPSVTLSEGQQSRTLMLHAATGIRHLIVEALLIQLSEKRGTSPVPYRHRKLTLSASCQPNSFCG